MAEQPFRLHVKWFPDGGRRSETTTTFAPLRPPPRRHAEPLVSSLAAQVVGTDLVRAAYAGPTVDALPRSADDSNAPRRTPTIAWSAGDTTRSIVDDVAAIGPVAAVLAILPLRRQLPTGELRLSTFAAMTDHAVAMVEALAHDAAASMGSHHPSADRMDDDALHDLAVSAQHAAQGAHGRTKLRHISAMLRWRCSDTQLRQSWRALRPKDGLPPRDAVEALDAILLGCMEDAQWALRAIWLLKRNWKLSPVVSLPPENDFVFQSFAGSCLTRRTCKRCGLDQTERGQGFITIAIDALLEGASLSSANSSVFQRRLLADGGAILDVDLIGALRSFCGSVDGVEGTPASPYAFRSYGGPAIAAWPVHDRCPRCGRVGCSDLRRSVLRWPRDVVVVTLPRFTQSSDDVRLRREYYAHVPVTLRLSDGAGDSTDASETFVLFAAVVHEGTALVGNFNVVHRSGPSRPAASDRSAQQSHEGRWTLVDPRFGQRSLTEPEATRSMATGAEVLLYVRNSALVMPHPTAAV